MNKNVCLAVAIVLALGATAASAASRKPAMPAPAATAEQIQELDEIVVHGKRLVDRINDAEGRFFPLYNKLNKKDDFDIKCGYAYLNPDSMIMSRICLPGFLGKSWGAPPTSTGTCYGNFNGYGTWGDAVSTGPCVDGGYEPPSPQFIFMAKSGELRQQMTKVVSSDPELLAMAAHLGDLYMELNSVQHRFRKAKGIPEKGERRTPRATKVNAGPRTR